MAHNQSPPAHRLVSIGKILRFAAQRGFAKFDELDLTTGLLTTAGILLTTKGADGATRKFATLTDGRHKIQLVLTSGRQGTPPELLAAIQRGGRVSVTGVPLLAGRSENVAVPSLFVVKLDSYSRPAPVTFERNWSPSRSDTTPCDR